MKQMQKGNIKNSKGREEGKNGDTGEMDNKINKIERNPWKMTLKIYK